MSAALQSQVVVERSKDKVVISGKPYYIHIVKKGETAYSISKAYGITVDELVHENPNASAGIKDGQALRLPVVATVIKAEKPSPQVKDETRFIYHKLSTGDTVYSLAKRFGVSEDEILQVNPGAEINRLPVGTEIAIPKREFTTSSRNLEVTDKEYITHRVQKGESVTSIAQKYGVTVREIRRENRGLIFPRVDDDIRIPVSRIAEVVPGEEVRTDTVTVAGHDTLARLERPAGYTPVENLKGKYNVAVLLPLYYGENSVRTEIDSSQFAKGKRVKKTILRSESWIYQRSMPFLELYQGILLASDTLRKQGLDINLFVYDIRQDTSEVTELIESGKLRDMDLIIGPVYSRNLAIVADYAQGNDIPVVSPVPLRSNAPLYDRRYLFMANPSLEVAQEMISKRISNFYDNNFVFIHSDTSNVDPNVTAFKNMIFRELSSKIPYEEIRFKELIFYNRSAIGNDSINRLEHTLSDKSDNIILIASEETPVISETIMDIHTLSKKYPVRIIGYPAMRELENLEPKYYFDLGIEIYSPFWIDYSSDDVRRFNKSFRKKFLTEPSEESFAWQGYDIAYYFLSGLAVHGRRFLRHPEIHNPDLLETEFDFIRTCDDCGFENHKLFLVKFTGEMDIKMMDEIKPSQSDDR